MARIITSNLTTTQPAGAAAPFGVWHFDEDANKGVDQTVNGNDLTSAGTWVYEIDALTNLTGAYFDGSAAEYLWLTDEAYRFAKDDEGGGTGAVTFEFIVKHTDGDNTTLVDCTGNGESLATNVLYRLYEGDGNYTYLCERTSSGTNVIIDFADAKTIFGEITYVVLTISADGQTRKIYINGELKSTEVALCAEKDASGNTQTFYFARSYAGGTCLHGFLYSTRITIGTYDDDQVAEVYQSISEEYTPVDSYVTDYLSTTNPTGLAAPLAVYHFTASGDYTYDQTGGGKALTSAGSRWVFQEDPVTGLTGAYFSGLKEEYLTREDDDFRLAKTDAGAGSGAYTIEIIAKYTQINVQNTSMLFEMASDGEDLESNVLYQFGNGDPFTFFAEYANGTNVSLTFTEATRTYGVANYYCLTCDETGETRKLYVNGELISTQTGHRAEKAGVADEQLLYIGVDSPAGTGITNNHTGFIYSMRITADAFTDDQALEAFERAAGLYSVLPLTVCSLPKIEGDGTITNYDCLKSQHRDITNGGGVVTTPFSLGTRFLHIRKPK